MPSDLDIYMDENDPSEPGDIKVVRQVPLVLDNCDSLSQWTIGAGTANLVLDTIGMAEGSAAVYASMTGTSVRMDLTKSSGSWDLSNYKYLKVYLRRPASFSSSNYYLYFGEAVYNEQTTGAFTIPAPDVWYQKIWDISGIAAASRNAVTIFSVGAQPTLVIGPPPRAFSVDYVFADPGASQLKSFDGDRVSIHYPKICTSTYVGTGVHRTITIARKGVPALIEIYNLEGSNTYPAMKWTSGMGNIAYIEGGGITGSSSGIHNVGDCSFDLDSHPNCNELNISYYFSVMWQD